MNTKLIVPTTITTDTTTYAEKFEGRGSAEWNPFVTNICISIYMVAGKRYQTLII